MISIGSLIAWDKARGIYVHASCARVLKVTVDAEKEASSVQSAAAGADLPTRTSPGLKPKSLETYRKEWVLYCRWAAQRLPAVPGRDAPWDADVLYNYMLWRAQTCAPSTLASKFTMLAHFGVDTGHALPNSKYDGGDPILRKKISRMKRQLRIDHAESTRQHGAPHQVHHCTALGKGSVDLVLSAFGVRSETAFNKLSRVDRHNVAITPLQHTAGMRFGHFIARSYAVDSFVCDMDGSYHLISDWSRIAEGTKFCLLFAASPRYLCQVYEVSSASGEPAVTVTAADVLRWHLNRLRRDGEAAIFAPVRGAKPSHDDRQEWLRATLRAALPENEAAAIALVEDVSPHSFHSGLASDLAREGVSLQVIGSVCRWKSTHAIRLYSMRASLSMSRVASGFRFICRSG